MRGLSDFVTKEINKSLRHLHPEGDAGLIKGVVEGELEDGDVDCVEEGLHVLGREGKEKFRGVLNGALNTVLEDRDVVEVGLMVRLPDVVIVLGLLYEFAEVRRMGTWVVVVADLIHGVRYGYLREIKFDFVQNGSDIIE